ncbi:VWD domain-containing protein [Rhodovulum adriaticum]|uniref:von Willebrand factor type D domain-containing protein n=1 Tax=Rhodovulum adriaticum TaxID=35804 RepID=A0A4R2P087_RHOAD|nr:VWD domain-containing protein [Rhodovulum adriaticum]MBK1634147.1 hypothetical protein [Rhodovulum adriaticum]TCP27304.1 von Willebrand factor type D domain-containing protein [Rhodovulum adriaticum]
MSDIIITPGFKDLLENDAILPELKNFTLDFLGEIEGLDDTVRATPGYSLTSTLVQIFEQGQDPDYSGLYTLSFGGSGIGPVSTLDELEQAIMEGVATGVIDEVTLDYEGTEIMSLDVAADSYSLVSGNQSLELVGTFPTSLADFGELVSMMDRMDDIIYMDGAERAAFVAPLMKYDITEVTLYDGTAEIAQIAFDFDAGTFAVTAGGYTLDAAITTPPLPDLLQTLIALDMDWGEGGLDMPHLRLYGPDGSLLDQALPDPDMPAGHGSMALIEDFVAPETGRYYLSAASVNDIGVGFYDLNYSGGPELDPESIVEDADAPANMGTPYYVPSWGAYSGLIYGEGDRDWVYVDLEQGETYSFFMWGFWEPPWQFEGYALGPITMTDPDGETILSIPETPITSEWQLQELLDEISDVLEALGLPPLPDDLLGLNSGDPHLLTLDGVAYDFHAAGEYVLTRATDGSDFEVQARMSPVGPNVTANVAAAVQLDGGAVMIDPLADSVLTVNGAATTIADGSMTFVGDDRIYREGDTYTLIHTRDGDLETGYSAVVVTVVDDRVDITVALDSYWAGNVEGLLGNANGNQADDVALADGTALARPLAFDDLYGQYRDDWRVDSEGESLFTYGAGLGPDSYYLPDYPTGMTGLDDFTQDQIDAAEAAVAGSGLTPGTVAFQQAVLDYLLTGDESYIDSAQGAQQVIDDRPGEAPPVDQPDTDGGGLDGLVVLSGTISDTQGADLPDATITFQPTGRSVNLIDVTQGNGDYAFDLVNGASGHLDGTRDYDSAGDPAITAADALDVLRLAVGLTPSFGAAQAQNFVAADVNGDGRVTAADALDVLRFAVGLDTDNAPRWEFFDSDTDWDGLGLDAGNSAVETGADIAALATSLEAPMTAILIGNMDEVSIPA